MFDRSQSTLPASIPTWAAIQAENRRQGRAHELIASENYTSPAVMAAQGSQLTNKYAEGYPGKRYYGGCENATSTWSSSWPSTAQSSFGAAHANVQANSGSQANQAVFFGLLQPGDTIIGMSLAEGRPPDPRHGAQHERQVVQGRELRPDAGAIDYDAMERLAHEAPAKLIIAGASAYSLRIDFERFAGSPRRSARIFMVDMGALRRA